MIIKIRTRRTSPNRAPISYPRTMAVRICSIVHFRPRPRLIAAGIAWSPGRPCARASPAHASCQHAAIGMMKPALDTESCWSRPGNVTGPGSVRANSAASIVISGSAYAAVAQINVSKSSSLVFSATASWSHKLNADNQFSVSSRNSQLLLIFPALADASARTVLGTRLAPTPIAPDIDRNCLFDIISSIELLIDRLPFIRFESRSTHWCLDLISDTMTLTGCRQKRPWRERIADYMRIDLGLGQFFHQRVIGYTWR